MRRLACRIRVERGTNNHLHARRAPAALLPREGRLHPRAIGTGIGRSQWLLPLLLLLRRARARRHAPGTRWCRAAATAAETGRVGAWSAAARARACAHMQPGATAAGCLAPRSMRRMHRHAPCTQLPDEPRPMLHLGVDGGLMQRVGGASDDMGAWALLHGAGWAHGIECFSLCLLSTPSFHQHYRSRVCAAVRKAWQPGFFFGFEDSYLWDLRIATSSDPRTTSTRPLALLASVLQVWRTPLGDRCLLQHRRLGTCTTAARGAPVGGWQCLACGLARRCACVPAAARPQQRHVRPWHERTVARS
jgi:hypothetical protein